MPIRTFQYPLNVRIGKRCDRFGKLPGLHAAPQSDGTLLFVHGDGCTLAEIFRQPRQTFALHDDSQSIAARQNLPIGLGTDRLDRGDFGVVIDNRIVWELNRSIGQGRCLSTLISRINIGFGCRTNILGTGGRWIGRSRCRSTPTSRSSAARASASATPSRCSRRTWCWRR